MKMIKSRKFSKFLLSIFLPVVVFLSIGFFSFGAISTALAMPFVTPDNAGGAFYIGNNSTFTMTTGTISGFSKTFGGGVYVADGGTFNMSGGAIYGNTATYSGSQIYNSGTFTMTGGTIGKNGTTASESGIYNQGEMNLYGGTIYEGILSSYASFSTKMACNIQGTITLENDATITVEDYAGTTPSYTIVISSTRAPGKIVTFLGNNTISPDISKFTVTGYNSNYDIVIRKNSNGYFELALTTLELPSTWKTEVASTDYMTTTVTPTNLTSIKFAPTVPSGYTKIGTLSTGLPVYKGTTATEIAFVGKKIFAPENSYKLFDSLSKLTTLDMSVLNTSKVTDMSFMFRSCSALTSLDVSGFDTSKVTNMSAMFRSCSALTSLGVSGFDTSKVTDMSMMFDTCSALTSLDVSGFNTSNVTHMRYMFYYCLKLTSLDLSNFNTSKVTDMNYMFRDCSALTSLDLSSFNMAKVTNSGNMLDFGTSNKIQTLKTPYNNSTAIAITTGSTLYKEDTGAVVTSVPANTTKSLTYVDETPIKTFPSTWKTEIASSTYMTTTVTPANLTSIKFAPTVPSGYTQIGTLSNGLPVYKGTSATDIAFVEKKIYAPENSSQLFDRLSKLTTLDMSVFDTSNATNMSYMFRYCSALTSLNVSNFDTSKVTDMSFMFYNCSALTSLDVSGFNTSIVTNMSSMFGYCLALTSLDVSGFNTSIVTNMSSMFGHCSALTSLNVSSFDTSKVTDMSLMFYNCSALTSLDLSSFNMAKVTKSENMLNFETLNKIQTLKTPYNNASEITITTGSTLYKEDTGAVVTSVPANTTKSLTYTNVSPFKTFPTTWKTEIASSTYMTSTVTVSSIKNIVFPTALNGAYTKIGTLSTGIDVYKSVYNSGYIAFYTGKKIYMPANCTQLFYGLNVEKMSFESVDTTKTTNMSQMFANCTSMKILDLSTFNMANVSTVTNMLNFGTTGALGRILTPYGNKTAVAITASSTLYDTSTDLSATGVLANSTASKTLAKKVTVTFNPYNGSAVSPSTYTKYYGERFGSSYPTTTRPDYTFEGWYTEISGGSSIDTYTLVGDTTFYAHWASNSGGGSGGGGTGGGGTTPTLPSGFERQHETSQLGAGTIDEQSIIDALDIFNSFESNTFTAEDVKIFSVVSPASGSQFASSEYMVEESFGNLGGTDVVRLSNNGSRYSFLSNEYIMGLYNSSSNIGFDQWYFFDSMFFVKIAELFPNLEILDLRGLDTSLTTFAFRIPDSVQIVIVPEDGCNATLVSNNTIQYLYQDNQSSQSNGYSGGYVSGMGSLVSSSLSQKVSSNISNEEMNLICGLAFISPLCPEQFEDYVFTYEYCEIENGIYLCLVETTDSFASRYGASSGETYLAVVSYASAIRIYQSFIDGGGFQNFPDAGTYNIIDFRGVTTIPDANNPDIASEIDLSGNIYCSNLILPLDYDSGNVRILINGTLLNPDGTTHSFLPIGAGESTGGLEISKQRTMLSVSAENVDLYIDDKKWFDPRKNKIQIKTQNDGEE